MGTPAGNFSWTFDQWDRLVGLTNSAGEYTSWGYRENDWLSYQHLANGVQTNYTLNPRGFLTDLVTKTANGTGTLLSEFGSTAPSGQMQYDAVGNRVAMTANIPAMPAYSGLTSYAFDWKDQLRQEQTPRDASPRLWDFDPAGNAVTMRGVGPYSYNAKNQPQVTGYSFDSNGNPTQYAGQTLGFDPEDRLVQLGSFTAGYNGDGQRAWKQVGSTRTYFVYDGATPLLETDDSGTVTAINTFGAAGLVSRRTGGVNGPTTFYTFDPQGNVCQRLDSTAAITATEICDAFGSCSPVSVTDAFRFGGQWGYYRDPD